MRVAPEQNLEEHLVDVFCSYPNKVRALSNSVGK